MGNQKQTTTQNTNGLQGSEVKLEPSDYSIEVPLDKGIISQIIKALRNIRNYSQTRLGRMLGVQKTQISKLEKGASNVTIGTMLKIFDALKARVSLSIKIDKKEDIEVLKDVIEQDKKESDDGLTRMSS